MEWGDLGEVTPRAAVEELMSAAVLNDLNGLAVVTDKDWFDRVIELADALQAVRGGFRSRPTRRSPRVAARTRREPTDADSPSHGQQHRRLGAAG